MNREDFLKLSLEEKKAFMVNLLKEIKEDSEELNNLYIFFKINEKAEEKDCIEVYDAILNTKA